MIRYLLLVLAALVLLGGCGSKEAESDTPAEEQASTFWELGGMLDDYTFDVKLSPIPLRPNVPLKLTASPSADDSDRTFQGQVWYRTAPTEQNQAAWTAMRAVKADEFEASVTLPTGTTFIQFKVQRSTDQEPAELTDWSVTLK